MIKASIVGLGRWGQTLVDSVQGKSDRIQFVRGVTRTPANAADYAKDKGFPLDSDYAGMLADPEVDAVVLATPPSLHLEEIEQAAAAGKHVLVEKPFTLTRDTAAKAVAVADKAGIKLCLAHNRRFLPAWAEMKKQLEAGTLGTLLHVESDFCGDAALRAKPGGWRADRRENPAGGMGAMGIHMVDTLIGLFGPVEEVTCISHRRAAQVDVDDTTAVLFRFKSGMTGYLGCLAATVRTWRIEAFGDKGALGIDQQRYMTHRPREGEVDKKDFGAFDMERAELEAFADTIEKGTAYPIPNSEAIHGIAVFEAIYKSADAGTSIKVA